MPSEVWDEMAYPFPDINGATLEVNFNGATVEIEEWISIFIPHFIMDVITYTCCD